MRRRTKIVCTLGPAVDSKEGIKSLIDAGMNVARLNCSHGDWETKRRWIKWIRELNPEYGRVAILADLQGPKFRLGDIEGGSIELVPDQSVSIGPSGDLPVTQEDVLGALCPNCRVLLGDGNVEIKLGQAKGENWDAKAVSGGAVRSRQGVTVVGRSFKCEVITDKDREDLAEATAAGVDYIALSYVRDADDINALRKLVNERDDSIRLCAKIETKEALKNIEEIVRAVDLVMVARGDLGLQMDFEEVPIAQKRIIQMCTRIGKPVITATQMLESMITAPRPTRAEATDVANAILDGTDALMLSGETAAGQYPVECVRTLVKIAEEVEKHLDRAAIERDFRERLKEGVSATEAVAHAVSDLAAFTRPDAILTTTTSGQTARLVSKFRPKVPIYCATWSTRVQAQMAVVWGVEALCVPLPTTTDEVIEHAIDAFFRAKRLKSGDEIIVTAGVPAGSAGNTNLILTQTV
jgi:pyruvate kinase